MPYILTCLVQGEPASRPRLLGHFATLDEAKRAARADAEQQGLTISTSHSGVVWGDAEPDEWSGATNDGRLRYVVRPEEQ